MIKPSRGVAVPNRTMIIALDGPSGVGKTSVISHVCNLLESCGYSCGVVANNEVALLQVAIRNYAHDISLRYPLALLTAAARGVIRVKSEGAIVLSDRGVLSTLVFQGFAGIPLEYLYAVNLPFIDDTVFVLLELPEDILRARREGRDRGERDWFKRTLSIEEEIARYRDAAAFLGDKGHQVIIVSMIGSISEAARSIADAVEHRLGPI